MGRGAMAGFQHSTSNLLDLLHGGRPKDEEPHVKRSVAKKDNDGIEYIVRVDLESLGILEEEFDDLQSLFEMFDRDKDGILSVKELQLLLRCLGLQPSLEQASGLASTVSCDMIGFSISFNEYLRLISLQRREDPTEEALLNMFQILDPDGKEFITEAVFRKIMRAKDDVTDEDVEEMIKEYKSLTTQLEEVEAESVIFYKGLADTFKRFFMSSISDFISMLQT